MCIRDRPKSTFHSLICEFTARAGKYTFGIFYRFRCDAFTVVNNFTSNTLRCSSASIFHSFAFSPLKPIPAMHSACSSMSRGLYINSSLRKLAIVDGVKSCKAQFRVRFNTGLMCEKYLNEYRSCSANCEPI